LRRPAVLTHGRRVPEAPAQRRRWNGFVCPECRHVFRVASDHDGTGVVCPSCRRLLKLPGEDEVPPPLVLPGRDAGPASSDPEAEESEGHEHRHRHRRRHRAAEFDETFEGKQEVSPMLVKLVIGSVSLLGLLVLAALLWPRDARVAGPPPGARPDGGPPAPAGGAVAEERELESQAVSLVEVERELVPVIRKFLDAGDLAEMVRYVRHPEQTLPRMRDYYGDGFQPPGLHKVLWKEIPRRNGEFITVTVDDRNFERHEVSLAEEEGRWRVDWESWAGWPEIGWDALAEAKPTEPKLFRVILSQLDYYNFEFSDESEWTCYRLESPDRQHLFYGYAPKGSEIDRKLLLTGEPKHRRRYLVRLRYPDEPVSDRQLLIEEAVGEGWLDPEGKS
jgi:hypothetical protein